MSVSCTISLVVYYPDLHLLTDVLHSLLQALKQAQQDKRLDTYYLQLVDNSGAPTLSSLRSTLDQSWQGCYSIIESAENLGYGRGHNLALQQQCGDYHLVLNPDVLLDVAAISACISCLQQEPRAGMITPICHRADGTQEWLCKAYPTLLVLLLRGFAPSWLRRLFARQLAAYDLSTLVNQQRNDVLIASGCFMFFRRQALQDIEGFCAQFFLYFEDFDLCLRLRQEWQIVFCPAARIVHFGGHSAKKGYQHILMFARSARLFFNRYGWRFW